MKLFILCLLGAVMFGELSNGKRINHKEKRMAKRARDEYNSEELVEAVQAYMEEARSEISREIDDIRYSERNVLEMRGVRLIGEDGYPNRNKGRVEVFMHGEWGTVCDDYANNTIAEIICGNRNLYCNDWDATPRTLSPGSGGDYTENQPAHIWMDDVECYGYEESIFDCQRKQGMHNCQHSEDLVIDCCYSPESDNTTNINGTDNVNGTDVDVSSNSTGSSNATTDSTTDATGNSTASAGNSTMVEADPVASDDPATTAAAPADGATTAAAPEDGPTTAAAPEEGVTTAAAPGDGATTAAAPADGATTAAAPGDGATTAAAPGDGATTAAAPGDGATTAAVPGDGATTAAAPEEGATTAAAPAETTAKARAKARSMRSMSKTRRQMHNKQRHSYQRKTKY